VITGARAIPRRAAPWAALLLLISVLAGLVGLGVRRVDGRLERATEDLRFRVRSSQDADQPVTIVAFDNMSLRDLNVQPPIPRHIQAEVIDRLDRAGARVIALDFNLEEPSRSERDDRAVTVALMNARHAVASVTAPGPDGSVAPLAGFLPFANTGVRPGYTGLPIDPDGVVREFGQSVKGLDPFAIAAAREFTGRSRIVPRSGSLIDFPGPTGSFPQLSYIDVLRGRFDARAVRGRVVVIGPTATVLGDQHQVPTDGTMPGPEVQAAAIATALDGFPLHRVGPATARRLALAGGFLVPLLLVITATLSRAWRIRRGGGVLIDAPSPWTASAFGAIAVAVWLIAAQLAFNAGTVVEVVAPLLAIVASVGLCVVALAVASSRARRRVRRQFAASDPAIVSQVLSRTQRRRAVTARDVIAGYTVEGPLGPGGMGQVWRATDARLGRSVALKLIKPERARDARARQRFVDEAHRASSVTHPNVVPVLDAGEDSTVLFLVMQLIDGDNLEHLLRNGHLEAPHAVRLLHRIACALDAVHQCGMFHHDVKPANILISYRSPEHPFLSDFGIAALAGGSPPGGGRGTPEYLAPERSAGRDSGVSADIYALAATMYQCLTGVVPFEGNGDALAAAHRNAARPRVTDVRPELPDAIDAVVATGLAVDPGRRYATATDLTLAAADALATAVVDDEHFGGAQLPPRPGVRSAIASAPTEAD
jgi:CHASE2 domain-containing sensor protein